MKMLDISVVITTFNRFSYLERLLKSLVNLSVKPLELIIINDGESFHNHFPDLLDEIKSYSINLKIIKSGYKKGANYCRNLGVSYCESEFVTFMDDDDAFDVDFFKNFQIARAKKPDVKCFYPSRKFVFDKDLGNVKRIKISKKVITLKNLSYGNLVGGTSGVTIKKEIFSSLELFFDIKMPALQDYEFWLRICGKEISFHPLEESFVFYTVQNEGIQISRSVTKWKSAVKILKEKRFFNDKKDSFRFISELDFALAKTIFRSSNNFLTKLLALNTIMFLLPRRIIRDIKRNF